MGLIRWFRRWFTPPPEKVTLLVVAPVHEVEDALRALPVPLLHMTRRGSGSDAWCVLMFETDGLGAGTGLVAVLAGRPQETEVELIGLGGDKRTKGTLADDARELLAKRFPVVETPLR